MDFAPEKDSPPPVGVIKPAAPWYYQRRWVIIILVCIAPLSLLAFPLLWLSPKFSLKAKIIITLATLVASYYLAIASIASWNYIQAQIASLKSSGIIS